MYNPALRYNVVQSRRIARSPPEKNQWDINERTTHRLKGRANIWTYGSPCILRTQQIDDRYSAKGPIYWTPAESIIEWVGARFSQRGTTHYNRAHKTAKYNTVYYTRPMQIFGIAPAFRWRMGVLAIEWLGFRDGVRFQAGFGSAPALWANARVMMLAWVRFAQWFRS